MGRKCDVLILTASFGLGHISVSQAIKEHVIMNNPSLNVEINDIFRILNSRLNKGVYKGYEILIKKNSKLYNYIYYKKRYRENLQIDEVLYKVYLARFARYILEKSPKLIISTFPISSGFTSKFKEKYKNSTPLITCITDIVDSWEWVHPGTDKYLVASKEVKEKLVRKGVDFNRIEVTGIPVRIEFLRAKDNKELYSKYNIKESDFVIMIMGGGMGLLPEDKEFYCWLNSLKNTKIYILTGKNEELYKKLTAYKDLSNIKVLNYINNVSELMRISDILITKAGGVTLFEAMAVGLPIIVYKPFLGQEIENSKFITEKGIGRVVNSLEELKSNINEIIKNKSYLDKMSKNIEDLSIIENMNNVAKCILELHNTYFSKTDKEYFKIS